MASQTACKFPSGFSFEKGWRPPSFWNSKNQNGHKNPHTEPVKFVIMRFLRKWLTVKLEVCWSEGLIQSKSQGRVLLHKIHTHTNTYMVLWNQRWLGLVVNFLFRQTMAHPTNEPLTEYMYIIYIDRNVPISNGPFQNNCPHCRYFFPRKMGANRKG